MTASPAKTISTVAFAVLAVTALALQLWIVFNGVFVLRLWEDEAFNLTVPLNVLRGLGYTSDGTLSGSELTMFDPRISTGPVVLLPITAVLAFGADPVIGGRLVILLFYITLLIGLWKLGFRIGGRWAALVAILVPLGWNTWNSGSPIQSPVDILGEVPAAALLVWALVCARNRPWLSGLFIGLAMQAKLLGGLASPAIAIVVLLTASGSLWKRLLRVGICTIFAVIPNVVNELWKFIVLGPGAYVQNLREFYWFFKTGGQDIAPVPPETKTDALVTGWASPVWLTVIWFIAIAVPLVFFAWHVSKARASRPRGDSQKTAALSERAVLALAAVVGLVLWLGWWVASAHTPNWPRYPAIAMYVFMPLLVAISFDRCRRFFLAPSSLFAVRVGAGIGVVALSLPIVAQSAAHGWSASHSRFGEDLAAQRKVAADFAAQEEHMLISDWGPEISIIVLAGAHAGLTDVPRLDGTPRVVRNYGEVSEFEAYLDKHCAAVPVRSEKYALCLSEER